MIAKKQDEAAIELSDQREIEGDGMTDATAFLKDYEEVEKYELELSHLEGEAYGHRRAIKREHFWAKTRVKLLKNGRMYQAKSRDIQVEGAGVIFIGETPELGDSVLLEFLPCGETPGFSVEAKIVYSIEDPIQKDLTNVGLQFQGATKYAQNCIQAHIESL